MRGIPGFVAQVHEIEQNLKNEWQSVSEGWRDKIAQDFNNEIMEPYMKNFQQYVTGDGIIGYGLEQLLQQMDNHLRDMDSLVE